MTGFIARRVNGMIAKDDIAATARRLRGAPGAMRYAEAEKEAKEMKADPPI